MSDQLITGFFAIGGTVVGALMTGIYNYCKERRDRKDRYFFALLKERIQVYQQAIDWAQKLKFLIHKDGEEKDQQIKKSKEWYYKHNLYLSPSLREKYLRFISKVGYYKLNLDVLRDDQRSGKTGSEQIKTRKQEIEDDFKEIMQGIQDEVQADIDLYYAYLK